MTSCDLIKSASNARRPVRVWIENLMSVLPLIRLCSTNIRLWMCYFFQCRKERKVHGGLWSWWMRDDAVDTVASHWQFGCYFTARLGTWHTPTGRAPPTTQGRHLGRGAGRVYGLSKDLRFWFFLCKSYLWNNVTAAKTLRYTDLDPKDHWDPQRFTKMTPLTTPRLTAALTINWSKCTLLIHGKNVF